MSKERVGVLGGMLFVSVGLVLLGQISSWLAPKEMILAGLGMLALQMIFGTSIFTFWGSGTFAAFLFGGIYGLALTILIAGTAFDRGMPVYIVYPVAALIAVMAAGSWIANRVQHFSNSA